MKNEHHLGRPSRFVRLGKGFESSDRAPYNINKYIKVRLKHRINAEESPSRQRQGSSAAECRCPRPVPRSQPWAVQ